MLLSTVRKGRKVQLELKRVISSVVTFFLTFRTTGSHSAVSVKLRKISWKVSQRSGQDVPNNCRSEREQITTTLKQENSNSKVLTSPRWTQLKLKQDSHNSVEVNKSRREFILYKVTKVLLLGSPGPKSAINKIELINQNNSV